MSGRRVVALASIAVDALLALAVTAAALAGAIPGSGLLITDLLAAVSIAAGYFYLRRSRP